MVDPWRSVTRDSTEKEYSEALSRLRGVLSTAPQKPACMIVHHLRKPKTEDRHKGRNLAFLLSGSDSLHAAARSLFILQPASDDIEDNRVVFSVAKISDGLHPGPRSAWQRKACSFELLEEFD